MGGLVVQKALERGAGHIGAWCMPPAVVLACPVPAFGTLPSTWSLALTRPALLGAINAVAAGGSASLERFAEALFSAELERERLGRYLARMQRESRRALLDMAGWGLPMTWRMDLPETLVLGAAEDALIAPPLAEANARLLGADYRLLPGLGHAAMLDDGWPAAAQAILAWLEEQGL